uniref:Soluble NSF attachment protein 29 n=1 Tax=Schistocephalus solidus TaxID=70667 RepID=A0A0X3Q3H8_SCHSO
MSRNPFDHDVTPWGRGPNSGNSLDEHFHQNTNISVSINSPQSRALASQQRALASISNSERVGLGTLEELNEQGEKLSRTEARVKEISELQKQGQQNINSLSSFFGGFKNLFSKKQSESIPKSPPPSRTGSNLSNVSPALIQPDFRRSSEFSHRSYSQPAMTVPSQTADADFENNLSQMAVGMARLKELASTMNTELKAQNEQLDRLQPAIDRVSSTTVEQNRQMNKLLGRKAPS